MTDRLNGLWARVTVHWSVAATAIVAALPSILDYLGVMDLKPILMHLVSEETAKLIIGVLPFVLAFLRPLVAVAPKEDEA